MMAHAVSLISVWAIPLFLLVIPVYGMTRRVKVYECFVEGAKEGFQIGVRIIPYLVAILVAVGMLRGAGAIDILAKWLFSGHLSLRFSGAFMFLNKRESV
jgi:spore maturation protein B